MLGTLLTFTGIQAQAFSVNATNGSGVIGGQASVTFDFLFDFSVVNPFVYDAADLHITYDGAQLDLDSATSTTNLFGASSSLDAAAALPDMTLNAGSGFFNLSFAPLVSVDFTTDRELHLAFFILNGATPGDTTVTINGFLNDESFDAIAQITIRPKGTVPEPTALSLIGMGLLAFAAARRKRGKTSA